MKDFPRRALFLVTLCFFANVASATPIGPVFPPPGGASTAGSSGSAGNAGGRTWLFSLLDPTAYDELYWGVSSVSPPTAGLDGLHHLLTYSGVSGDVATFTGSSPWTNPDTGVTSPAVPLELRIKLLSGASWVTAASVGLSPALGVVADVGERGSPPGWSSSPNRSRPSSR
jgi:hypothetical protein